MTKDNRNENASRFVWSDDDIKVIRGQDMQPTPVTPAAPNPMQRAAQVLPQLQELMKNRGR